jgi:hypothetical protein
MTTAPRYLLHALDAEHETAILSAQRAYEQTMNAAESDAEEAHAAAAHVAALERAYEAAHARLAQQAA